MFKSQNALVNGNKTAQPISLEAWDTNWTEHAEKSDRILAAALPCSGQR